MKMGTGTYLGMQMVSRPMNTSVWDMVAAERGELQRRRGVQVSCTEAFFLRSARRPRAGVAPLHRVGTYD